MTGKNIRHPTATLPFKKSFIWLHSHKPDSYRSLLQRLTLAAGLLTRNEDKQHVAVADPGFCQGGGPKVESMDENSRACKVHECDRREP